MGTTRVPLLFGCGQVGTAGRVHDPAEVQRWVDLMVQHGQTGVDTARRYSDGTSEQLIAQLDLKGMRVDTKAYPFHPGDHAPAALAATFARSRAALGAHRVRVFYLHVPDRAVPFEETLGAVHALYAAGEFEEFGLSNFMAWEVAEVVGICRRRGFVQPTVYQGIYNLLSRGAEDELFPCLRKFNIKFCAYTVLAGGFLAGHLLDAPPAPGTHFDASDPLTSFYRTRYTDAHRAPVRALQACAARHGLRLAEVAYRWLQHHSALAPGDHGVILGATRAAQLEDAIVDSEAGPLPQEVVEMCEETWRAVRGVARPYFHEGLGYGI